MVKARLHLITAALFLVLGFLAGAGYMNVTQEPEVIKEIITEYIEVPKEVIVVREVPVIVVREVEIQRELSDFASIEEFKEVISRHVDGLTIFNGDCVEGARFLVEVLGSNGYYIDTEVVASGKHMIIKGFIVNEEFKAICYYDPRSNRFWHIYKDAITYQSLQTYTYPSQVIPPDDEPNWGPGGNPNPLGKPDKPSKPDKDE